jgi:hypothetical protein
MDASAILEYFKPLSQWLTEQNQGLSVGWDDDCPLGSTEKVRPYQMRSFVRWRRIGRPVAWSSHNASLQQEYSLLLIEDGVGLGGWGEGCQVR